MSDKKNGMAKNERSEELTDPLTRGLAVIRSAVKTLPATPGVYRMLDKAGDVLYVGKAKNLKKRVVSYTNPVRLSTRIARMVAKTRSLAIVTTHTEAEALLLEANFIKRYKTPYNILLRDDKSFPHILLRQDHEWAQITKHRGAQKKKGIYYGPFASAGAVNRTLNTLQKAFLLRSCSDSVFNNRSRPCLLHQIKRCSAPCVGRISKEGYDTLVADTRAFLSGRNQDIQKRLADAMEEASERLDFEVAAAFRDRLRALALVQTKHSPRGIKVGDADVIAGFQRGGQTCIQVFFYRAGQSWGNRAYFPRHEKTEPLEAVLSAFIAQFYDNKPPPAEILVNAKTQVRALLEEALSVKAGRKVTIRLPKRGNKRELIREAERNAGQALDRKLAESATQNRLLQGVAQVFGLETPPDRVEVYDNSHISGSHAVGAMVVAGSEGFQKNAYRVFKIKSAELTPGDDYAMMREVLLRRFSRAIREDSDKSRGLWPDLVLIDGGKGQLSAAHAVLEDLGIDDVPVVAISKGPDRDAGREQFHRTGRPAFSLDHGNPVLYYLQRLRDEAHRFAIGSHRVQRKKAIKASPLDGVPGIGAKRKKALLHHFGSASAVEQAGVKDLALVEGVSLGLAQTIYDYFHDNG